MRAYSLERRRPRSRGQKSLASRPALSSQASTTLCLAGLLVEFANAHFLLDAAPLDKFSETSNGLLGGLFLSQCQLNHIDSCFFLYTAAALSFRMHGG